MDVAITSVAETRNRKPRLRAQPFRELHKVDNATARYYDIFIQFGKASRAQRIAELATQCPKSFTIFFTGRYFERIRLFTSEQFSNRVRFAAHALFLTVKIDEQVRVTFRNKHLAKVL